MSSGTLLKGVVLVFLLCGCSMPKNVLLKPIPLERQGIVYKDNFQHTTSEGSHYHISVFPAKELILPHVPIEFGLFFYNNSDKSVNLSADNIRAYCGNNELKVFTWEEAYSDFQKGSYSNLMGLSPEQIGSIEQQKIDSGYYKNQSKQSELYFSMLLKRQNVPSKNLYRGLFKVASPNPKCEKMLIIQIDNSVENHTFMFKLIER